ncbi:MAG TPA: hypothetical protein ENH11_10305 [Candidatus Acetothermia bacterium]|nr:hypothetical protein [Candidatus Acetothermia bacterium]
MRGDKILVQQEHQRAAATISEILSPTLSITNGRFAISIGGESGSGKSELAVATSEALEKHGIGTLILQQDDYFVYPPHTNDARRREDINRVGPGEVHLALLDDHVKAVINGAMTIDKPLVVYQDDRIVNETLPLGKVDVVIVEGTYTTLLKNVHSRIFIDRAYEQTRNTRLKRNREPSDPFLERVLSIEHNIILAHKYLADIIITQSFAVVTQVPNGEIGVSPIRNEASLQGGDY